MVFRHLRVIPLILALALVPAACTSDSGDSSDLPGMFQQDGPTRPNDEPVRTDAIKDFSFGDVTWTGTVFGPSVTLRDGFLCDSTEGDCTGEFRPGWSVDPEHTHYSDADGDGFVDALVGLHYEAGNGYSTEYYVWRWDPETEEAVQIPGLVARHARCGDLVRSIEPADTGFVVVESRRYADDMEPCSRQPDRETTRTIGLEDGWLIELAPGRGYGGQCPHEFTIWDGEELTVATASGEMRVGPDRAAPVAVDKTAVLELEIGPLSDNPDVLPLISFRTESSGADPHTWPCGYLVE